MYIYIYSGRNSRHTPRTAERSRCAAERSRCAATRAPLHVARFAGRNFTRCGTPQLSDGRLQCAYFSGVFARRPAATAGG